MEYRRLANQCYGIQQRHRLFVDRDNTIGGSDYGRFFRFHLRMFCGRCLFPRDLHVRLRLHNRRGLGANLYLDLW